MHFHTPSASPVNDDSSTQRSLATNTLPSAGIFTPSVIIIKSFGTSSSLLILFSTPFLITAICGAERFFNALRVLSVFHSWIISILIIPNTNTSITTPSWGSPSMKYITAATNSNKNIGSFKTSKIFKNRLSFLVGISSFLPYLFRAILTSSSVKPFIVCTFFCSVIKLTSIFPIV